MNWKTLLEESIESTYKVTGGLLNLVEEDTLAWKPDTGANWMTMGQLLCHLSTACGTPIKGFVTGDWGLPEGMSLENLSPEDMLPPAEALPTVTSVAEAKTALASDKQLALDMLAQCEEKQLDRQLATAPWDHTEMPLGRRLLQMTNHLELHKAQLFYYLKLQGKLVNTGHLWG